MYRETNGRFARGRKVKVGVALVFIAVGGYFVWGAPVVEGWLGSKIEATNEIINEVVIDKSDEKFAAKIDVLKDEVVEELAKCESGGYAADAGIIVFDTNNKASVGILQMQKDHVKHFYKTLYGKTITGQEAVVIAVTPDTAKSLAKDVLFKVEDGWREWFNCGTKLRLSTKIDYIKKLEN
jgi:hypothetical protein